jgi:hypothetical protein
VGCGHAATLFRLDLIEAPSAADAIARWDAEAERLFAVYTARWTPEQRAAFRGSLAWPVKTQLADS